MGADPHEWIPRNFEDFLKELDHITNSCEGNCPLFRGHADKRWLLESSFVRNCKKLLLDIEPHIKPSKEIRESVEYHQALFGLLLLKYDVLVRPSIELRTIEQNNSGIDAMFEMIKRFQQYPEEDRSNLKGTFFLDWSQKKDVGIFFANFDSNEQCVRNRKTDGALFICDKTATKKCFMRQDDVPIKVEEIINKMIKEQNKGKAPGCPLLFFPPKQILCQKANNQGAIYWAQMDLRYDLEEIWKLKEKDKDEEQYIFIKLILPYESQKECAEYLITQKITHSYLFTK
ncbi:MAG: hypothetical protein ACYS30_08525 [Planctomycetota bacterium]